MQLYLSLSHLFSLSIQNATFWIDDIVNRQRNEEISVKSFILKEVIENYLYFSCV